MTAEDKGNNLVEKIDAEGVNMPKTEWKEYLDTIRDAVEMRLEATEEEIEDEEE